MNTSIVDLLEAYPLPEQKETPPYKIYCDMDGVLTDFEKRFHQKLNEVGPDHYPLKDIQKVVKPKDFEAIFGIEEFWNFIDKQREFFKTNPRMRMLVSSFDRMNIEKKEKLINTAHNFLKNL